MQQIVKAPQEVLSTKARHIEKIDRSIRKLVKDMTETLNAAKDPEGVGLAAPQIGKSLQLFIAKPTRNSPILVYINPTITALTGENRPMKKGEKKANDTKLEGCLSLDDIWGEVNRFQEVDVTYTDLDGKEHKEHVKGFLAVIIQHEVDHLNGILFPKRVLEQKGKMYKSTKNEKGENVFEEISI